jgi:hypothetical protein
MRCRLHATPRLFRLVEATWEGLATIQKAAGLRSRSEALAVVVWWCVSELRTNVPYKDRILTPRAMLEHARDEFRSARTWRRGRA